MPIAMKPYLRRLVAYRDTGAHAKGGGGAVGQPAHKIKKKIQIFANTMIWNFLCDLAFSQNRLLKSADDLYIGILEK